MTTQTITRKIDNLSTSKAEAVLSSLTGWTRATVNNIVLGPAQINGTYSYRNFTVTADDDAQCYHISITEEVDD